MNAAPKHCTHWLDVQRHKGDKVHFFPLSFSKSKPVRSLKSWRIHFTCLKPVWVFFPPWSYLKRSGVTSAVNTQLRLRDVVCNQVVKTPVTVSSQHSLAFEKQPIGALQLCPSLAWCIRREMSSNDKLPSPGWSAKPWLSGGRL